MAQVTHLTGIQGHTLRVWERRYDFVKAKRKESKFRYYTEDQLRKLLNTAILLKNGYKISSIAKLTDEQIHDHVEHVFDQNGALESEKIKALVLAMLVFKEASFHRIYDQSVASLGVLRTFQEVIYPFLTLLGGLWVYNKSIPSHEHFMTNLIRQKLISAIEDLPPAAENARSIVLLLLEGDNHELGLLLGSYIAKKAGWKVIYLGMRVPAGDVESILNSTKAEVVFSTFTIMSPQPQLALVSAVKKKANTKLLLSGRSDILASFPEDGDIFHLKNPRSLQDFLSDTTIS